ncbi:MAG: hypothetical protein ACLRWQ_20510 [Flavonifractor plautii]
MARNTAMSWRGADEEFWLRARAPRDGHLRGETKDNRAGQDKFADYEFAVNRGPRQRREPLFQPPPRPE